MDQKPLFNNLKRLEDLDPYLEVLEGRIAVTETKDAPRAFSIKSEASFKMTLGLGLLCLIRNSRYSHTMTTSLQLVQHTHR